MQLLGYRHVITTLWSIYDSPAPEIADAVYATLNCNGTLDASRTPHALHHAISALRARHPTDPSPGRPTSTPAPETAAHISALI